MANFDFLKGNIETVILSSLFTGDKYGYEIAKEIKEKTGNQYEIKQATLYGYLKRLEMRELVRSYWGEESHGGRRRYFALSEQGKGVCRKFSAEWNFHKNILENLVADEAGGDGFFAEDQHIGRDKFFGSKTPRPKKIYNSDSDNEIIARELEKIRQAKNVPGHIPQGQPAAPAGGTASAVSGANPERFANAGKTAADNSGPDGERNDERRLNNEINLFDEISRAADSGRVNAFGHKGSETGRRSLEEENLYSLFEHGAFKDAPPGGTIQSPAQAVRGNAPVPSPQAVAAVSPAFTPPRAAAVTQAPYIMRELKPAEGVGPQNQTADSEHGKYYKSALSEILGEQITDTDLKMVHYAPKKEERVEITDTENIVELAEAFSKDGVKMRFYNASVSQYRAVPMLLKNKINCAAAWAAAVLFAAALAAATVFNGTGYIAAAISATVFLIFPFYFTSVYLMKPHVQTKPKRKSNYTLINRIVIFFICALFVLSADFILFRLDFSDFEAMLTRFLIPVLALAALPVAELVYKLFLNWKIFYT